MANIFFKKLFPKTYHCIVLMAVDNGMITKDSYTMPDEWRDQLGKVEVELAALSSEELQTFIMGDEAQMVLLQERCPIADKFFASAFEGELNEVLYGE